MKSNPHDAFLKALLAKYKRVIYDKNPLIEVTLQVRFPTYLALRSAEPSQFQTEILSEYPHYQFQEGIELRAQGASSPPAFLEMKTHIFLSADKRWRVAVAPESISFSTKEYAQWEEFRERASSCLKRFFKIYPIKVIVRVGLRYRNLIQRTKIEKAGRKWSDLINPLVLGPLGADEFTSINVDTAKWQQVFKTDNLTINFQGGLAKRDDEQCYLLDCDVSIPKELMANEGRLDSELERLHQPAGAVFRWAIRDELEKALGPKPVKQVTRDASRRHRR